MKHRLGDGGKGGADRSYTKKFRDNAGKVKNNIKPTKTWESAESKKRNNRS